MKNVKCEIVLNCPSLSFNARCLRAYHPVLAYNDAVADPEPYPGATPEVLQAAGLALPYHPFAGAGLFNMH